MTDVDFAPAPLDRLGDLAVALGWHPLYTHPQAVGPLTPAAWQRADGTRVPNPPGWAALLAEVERLRADNADLRAEVAYESVGYGPGAPKDKP